MLISRKKPHSGRPLTTFPVSEDVHSKRLGFKVGYCGCGEEAILPFDEAQEVVSHFAGGLDRYAQAMGKLTKEQKPKIPISIRLAKWLVKDHEEYSNKLRTVEEDFRSG